MDFYGAALAVTMLGLSVLVFYSSRKTKDIVAVKTTDQTKEIKTKKQDKKRKVQKQESLIVGEKFVEEKVDAISLSKKQLKKQRQEKARAIEQKCEMKPAKITVKEVVKEAYIPFYPSLLEPEPDIDDSEWQTCSTLRLQPKQQQLKQPMIDSQGFQQVNQRNTKPSQTQSEPLTKKQRENLKKREKEKALKTLSDATQVTRLATYRNDQEKNYMKG